MPFQRQSLLICYLVFGLVNKPSATASANSARHPLHLSSTEMNYNAKSGTIETSCRIFTDDFETILAKNYKVKTDLIATAKHKEMDALISKYMLSHFKLAANGKPLTLSYLGFENDKEAVVVYLESSTVSPLKKLETASTVLYDLFDDQINIFHITAAGKRQSFKLNYPENKLLSAF